MTEKCSDAFIGQKSHIWASAKVIFLGLKMLFKLLYNYVFLLCVSYYTEVGLSELVFQTF